ncbi:phosphoenolpyruvate synthase [Verrucomicrobia bacterium LW23]|nr:phosphoenolpyruvate synthase [Verrucomicrobia bacterium LW23]
MQHPTPISPETDPGGKARALMSLAETPERPAFPVPPFQVVAPQAFMEALSPSQRDALSQAATAEQAAEILRGLAPSPRWIAQELPRLRPMLGNPAAGLAVRSSAADEDGAGHSFAGQLDSFLHVSWDDVATRISDVWRSGYSPRIYAYRKQAGLDLPPPAPAVIIQAMIPAEAAGVAFSADPVSGSRSIAVVAAVRGTGEKLVSGEADGETYRVSQEGDILQGSDKAPASPSPPTLSGVHIKAVAALARRCAAHFGLPQDIEWALHDDKIWLLQSRPITSLAGRPDPDGAWQLWDNSNISESYNGVTTPLTFSFARQSYEAVYRQFVTILGVPQRRIDQGADVFPRMLGLIRGRVYYNMVNWYRVLAMLPGFAINRTFMEQMMGVKEPLPQEVMREFESAPAQIADYAELLSTIAGLIRSHWTLPKKVRAFYARLDAVLNAKSLPLSHMRLEQLASSFREIQSRLLTHWDAPLINDFFAMIYYGTLRKLCTSWCGDTDGTLQNNLVAASSEGAMISAEPARRIQEMARLAAAAEVESPGIVATLSGGNLAEIYWSLDHNIHSIMQLRHAFAQYLDKFGERCLEELKLESATLHDDPLMLYRAVGRLAGTAAMQRETQGPGPAALRTQAERRVEDALAHNPLRYRIFCYVLNQARARIRDRENLRFERTRVFGRARRIFVEIGKRLHAEGRLEAPRDIFYLTIEEIFSFIDGTAATTDLRGLIALRVKEFQQFRDSPPPADRFATRGAVYVGNAFDGPTATAAAPASTSANAASQRTGTGCCPGIVRAKVRVILSPRHAQIEVGEILVAPRTDPGWIMLFPSAAGLLVEHGSLLSHSAIVAREMGIPAIVSIPGLTSWLHTGDEVEFDGSTGRILLIRKTLHEAEAAT